MEWIGPSAFVVGINLLLAWRVSVGRHTMSGLTRR